MIKNVLAELRPYILGMRGRIAGLAVLAATSGVAEAVALLIAVRLALGIGGSEGAVVELPIAGAEMSAGIATLVAVIGALVSLATHTIIAWLTAKTSAEVLVRTRERAVQAFVNADWSTQALEREGALQETVATLSLQTSLLANRLVVGGAQAITTAAVIGAAVVVDPFATMIVVVGGILIVGCLRPLTNRTQRWAREFVDVNSDYSEEVARLTASSMELKAFGVQHDAERNLSEINHSVGKRQLRSRFAVQFGSSLYKDLAVLLLVGTVGVLAIANPAEITGIGVVVTLVIRSLASAQQTNNAMQMIRENFPSLESLNRRLRRLADGEERFGQSKPSRFDSIVLDDVGYSYGDGAQALRGVSLELARNEAIGVVGPSGGGKSTLVQILLRLRVPSSGSVLLGDLDYQEVNAADWAHLVALVPQEPSLLEATITENIAYYRDISADRVRWAASEANVLDDILAQPEGFDTKLGPRGAGLSGGQKQRVAIARALAGTPELLVMDEPSSALDVHSEQLLGDAIARMKGHTTLVIIAHRLKTLEACDRLVVIEGGSVTQLGTPADLAASTGFYRSVQEAMQSS